MRFRIFSGMLFQWCWPMERKNSTASTAVPGDEIRAEKVHVRCEMGKTLFSDLMRGKFIR